MTTKEKVCEALKNEIFSHLENTGIYHTMREFHITCEIDNPMEIVDVLDHHGIDPDDVECGEYEVHSDK